MKDSDKVLAQALELARADLIRLSQRVDSLEVLMKQVELWQTTMDMTLKHSLEKN